MKAGRNSPARCQAGFWSGYLPLAVGSIVVAAAVYSFSPRSFPPAEPTQVHAHDLLVTGLARQDTRILAAGEQGQILIADSPEGPWHSAKLSPQRGSNLVRVIAIDDKVAIAVGHDSWILRSEDRGETWSETSFDPERSEPLLAVAGPFDERIIAVGGFGQFMVSSDQGRTWARETHEALGDFHLNALVQLADGRLLVAGERGMLAVSSDAGRNWEKLPEIYAGSFFGALNLADGRVLVFGMRGNAFFSDDLSSWTRSQTPGTLSLFGGAVDADGSALLVADNDTVLRSRDAGRSFQIASAGERQRLVTVLPIDGQGWLLAGEAGISLRTAQGDAS